MKYTAKQIENAKRNYNSMLKVHTLADYDVENIGRNTAEQRMDYHNRVVCEILAGNQELEKEWKLFFLKEEVKADQKAEASKSKLNANKEASADILAPIKSIKKLGEYRGEMKGFTIYTKMPKGWFVLNGATTAPYGYVVICNGKSRFGAEYKNGIIKL